MRASRRGEVPVHLALQRRAGRSRHDQMPFRPLVQRANRIPHLRSGGFRCQGSTCSIALRLRPVARMRDGVVIADLCFPGERPAANGHLLRSRHNPRRRSRPAATLGHAATSRGALPDGSCSCPPRLCQRRQRHAGLAESPCQSSVFLYVLMVKIVSEFRDTQPLRQASPHRDVMCGQTSAAGQARSRCLTPAEVFEFGELGIRRAEENELPAATNHRGSSRKVRDAWVGGRYRQGFCAALSWRGPRGLRPRA